MMESSSVCFLLHQQWPENCFLHHPALWISWAHRHALTPMCLIWKAHVWVHVSVLFGNQVLHRRETSSYMIGRKWKWSGPPGWFKYSRPSGGGRGNTFCTPIRAPKPHSLPGTYLVLVRDSSVPSALLFVSAGGSTKWSELLISQLLEYKIIKSPSLVSFREHSYTHWFSITK